MLAAAAMSACTRSNGDEAASDSAARAAALSALSGDSTTGGAAPGAPGARATPKVLDETGLPDVDLVRRMIQHHQALVTIANATADRRDVSDSVRADARRLARDYATERDSLQALSERSLREHHTLLVLPATQQRIDRTLADSGSALDRGFRRWVVEHHREGNRMIDEYLPQLELAQLKAMLQRTRERQAREIANQR